MKSYTLLTEPIVTHTFTSPIANTVENLNLMKMEKYKREEIEIKIIEARAFTWFGCVSLRP